MTHFSTEDNSDILIKAHLYAKEKCMNEVTSNRGINEYWMQFAYRKWFIIGLFETAIKQSQGSGENWTFKKLEEELIKAGIPNEAIDLDEYSYLIIDAEHDIIQLNYDSYGRTILYYGHEFEVGRWDRDTVKLLKLIYDKISSDSYIKLYADNCLADCLQEELQQKIVDATARGILKERFIEDESFQILEAYSQNDRFHCKINTSWGTIDFEDELPNLSCTIDSLIQAQRQFQNVIRALERETENI